MLKEPSVDLSEAEVALAKISKIAEMSGTRALFLTCHFDSLRLSLSLF